MLDLFPDSARVEAGVLGLGGMPATELAERFGTPLVVYCEDTLLTRARALRGAVGESGRVFAFEPTATAEMLRANLRHNGVANAEVHEVALAATSGEREDRVFRLWGTEGEVRTWPFVSFDDFIARNGIERVDCLKIDVDSFDFEVLKGAEQTLLKHDPVVVVELNYALAKRGQSAGEALAWLAQCGYRKALLLDTDNFVLQRGEQTPRSADGRASLQLFFPPPVRIDETMATSVGVPVDDDFFATAELQNGAIVHRPEAAPARFAASAVTRKAKAIWDRVRGADAQQPARQAPLAYRDVVDLPVETTAARWCYALVLQLQAGASDGRLAIEVGVQVSNGKLGIGVCGEDSSRFCAPERTLSAMSEPQRVVIKARVEDVRTLVFRNVAADGVRTSFKITSLKARRSVFA